MSETFDDIEALPPFLAEVAEIAGHGAALALAAARGGMQRVYIPRPTHLRSDHWLVQAVGFEAACLIAGAFQRRYVDVPLGPLAGSRARTHAALRRAFAAGQSNSAAARLAGVSQRTAVRFKGTADADDRQIELPLAED